MARHVNFSSTAKLTRDLDGGAGRAHMEMVTAIRRARARVIYRNLPWYHRAWLTVAAWLEIN